MQHLWSGVCYELPVLRWIYSFHMPLFMALVGYFSVSLLQRGVAEGLWRRFQQLVIPAWMVLLVNIMLGLIVINTPRELLYRLLHDLWFLKSAFICTALFVISTHNARFRTAGLIASLVVSQMLNVVTVPLMYPCFVFGYLLRRYASYIRAHRGAVALVSGIIFILLIPWDSLFWPGIGIDSRSMLFLCVKRVYRLVLGCSATVALICLFEMFCEGRHVPGWLVAVGQSTLGIYLVQSVLLERLLPIAVSFDGWPEWAFSLLVTPAIAACTVAACMLLIRLLRLHRLTGYLFLGTPLRRRSCRT
ncbi:MAG: acyltransferase family protein [Candidatus Amulumruptor caecigallinarius]|nr:acyltransferase family protein [Candidatus Amulumruptor caecigallinarius]MCM1397035.1 acyltransferase family protein [Candidatus Amulumruptor caecigallinarius]MCM1454029.1 acyltransferase family protein [bacterium]